MAKNKDRDMIYRVQFSTIDVQYDLYVQHVYPADMAGFICLEGFLFNEESQLLVDPRSEKLRHEFAKVDTCFVPYHHIARIDQVSQVGESRVSTCVRENQKIQPFPTRN